MAVTALPDVVVRKRDSNDNFLILASDGIWDCLTSERCIQKLGRKIMRLESPEDIESLSYPIEDIFQENLANSVSAAVVDAWPALCWRLRAKRRLCQATVAMTGITHPGHGLVTPGMPSRRP